jgi:hypothetical protein
MQALRFMSHVNNAEAPSKPNCRQMERWGAGTSASNNSDNRPSKEAVRTGHELLMRWCTATATALNAMAHPLFDACVLHVSGQRHKAPTRHFLMLALDRLAERVQNHMCRKC